MAVFAWWELRIEHPLIDLRVFAVRAFSTAAASVTVIFFALFGSLFVLTQYLQLVHGYSPLSAGVRALPFALAMGAMSPLSPVLAKRLGTRVIIPAGIALMGGGLLDLSTASVHTSYPPLAVAVAIMGAGMGLVMAPASTTIMTTVPAHQAGAGSAINDTIREVGGALGVAIVGSLSAAVYRSRLGSVLAAAHAPGHVVHAATSSVAAADAVGRRPAGRRARARGRRARRLHALDGDGHAGRRGRGARRRRRRVLRPAAAPAAAAPGGRSRGKPGGRRRTRPGSLPRPGPLSRQPARPAAAGRSHDAAGGSGLPPGNGPGSRARCLLLI